MRDLLLSAPKGGRRPTRILVALALLFATGQAAARPAAAAELDRAIDQQVSAARGVAAKLGVHVLDVETGKEVYSFQPDEARILASNTKLFTSAAALDLMGPEGRFETPLLIRGAVYDSVLGGDLAVVGGGDPNISGRFHDGDSFAVFKQWAEVLKKRGVREVTGNLYLVTGLFSGQEIHPDWPRDQLARWYEAPVAALSFNDNCVMVRVTPGSGQGARAKVELVPDLGLYRLVNRVSTTSSSKRHSIAVTRLPDSHEIEVRGNAYVRAEPTEAWVTVPDPTEYFGAALRRTLAREGIRVHGRMLRVEQLPGAVWERVYTERSSLLETLGVVNRRSQNFYAESTARLLGARYGAGGSWRESVPVVESFLDRAGLAAAGYGLADGSGMSRNNHATPRNMTALLRYMYFHPHGEEFVSTLPYSGSTNSNGWRRRLAEAPYRGNVFAKTGTLNGVVTLSGYAKGVSGRLYAFSILCNDVRAVWRARRAQDDILRALIANG